MIEIINEFSHKDKNFSSSRQHGIILHVPNGHLKDNKFQCYEASTHCLSQIRYAITVNLNY